MNLRIMVNYGIGPREGRMREHREDKEEEWGHVVVDKVLQKG